MHGLGDLVPSAHEFMSPVRRQSTLPDVRFHRAILTDSDVTVVDGLPVTTVVRTAADFAAASLDVDHLAAFLSATVEHPGVDLEELAAALLPHAALYGYDTGHALVADVVPGYLTAVLRNDVSEAVTHSRQFRKMALHLLDEPDGGKALLALLNDRLASS